MSPHRAGFQEVRRKRPSDPEEPWEWFGVRPLVRKTFLAGSEYEYIGYEPSPTAPV
jgi:hypothetical protein